MDIKWIRNCCLLILLLGMKAVFPAQGNLQKDTLDRWTSKFYETEGVSMSSDGRWVAMKKRYTDKDSLFIFDTQTKKRDPHMAVKASMITLYEGDYAMLTGPGKVSWWNLQKKYKLEYNEVKQSGLWSSNGYCILNTRGELQIIDAEGKVLAEISDVVYYVTDRKGNLFVQQKTEMGYGILKFQDLGFRKLLDLNDFERMELTESGQYLAIYKKSKAAGFRSLMVMDIRTGSWSYPVGEDDIRADFFTVLEIGKGSSFLIQAVQYIPYPEKDVEIWYGNDRDLESRELGRKPLRRYWIWKPESDNAVPLSTKESETVSSIGNDRYFVVFRGDELQDYVRYVPDINLSLYDTFTGQKIDIGRVSSRLISSKDGSLLLLIDTTGIWQLLNVETLKKQKIEGKGLKKPYFSQDSRTVYFESELGLWVYSVELRKMACLSTGRGKQVQIVGVHQRPLCIGYNFYQSYVQDKKGLILKIDDGEKDTVSYYILKNEKGTLLYSSTLILKSVLFSEDLEKMAVLEESFNRPPRLWMVDCKTQEKKLLFDSESSDQKAKLLRQQIISYTTSSGLSLKGILYYPANYDPLLEYPVIVHIYQKQSDQAKNYLLPRYDEVGFNIRTLVEKGYFVYLPDIVTENGSPGYSGLDGVERSLDALEQYSLRIKRIGLMGHSFGSYLTNFIATHSNRFTAYISGSGVSDLTSSYFSYNRNYSSPHYWQLETGQYEMGQSFFQDKELYFKNNPIVNADRVEAPVLLWTGLKDRNVVPEQTMEFYIALRRSGKQVVALLYPDSGHDLGIGSPEAKDLNRRIIEWWDYFLKEGKPADWIVKGGGVGK